MEKLNSFNETASEIGQPGASVYTAPWSLVSTQAVCILSNDSPIPVPTALCSIIL